MLGNFPWPFVLTQVTKSRQNNYFDLASRLSDTWPISGKTKNRKLLLKVKPASPSAGLESRATGPPSNPHPPNTHLHPTKPNKNLHGDYHFPRLLYRASTMRDRNNISVCYVLNANTRAKPAATIKWWSGRHCITAVFAQGKPEWERNEAAPVKKYYIKNAFVSGLLKYKSFGKHNSSGSECWVLLLFYV